MRRHRLFTGLLLATISAAAPALAETCLEDLRIMRDQPDRLLGGPAGLASKVRDQMIARNAIPLARSNEALEKVTWAGGERRTVATDDPHCLITEGLVLDYPLPGRDANSEGFLRFPLRLIAYNDVPMPEDAGDMPGVGLQFYKPVTDTTEPNFGLAIRQFWPNLDGKESNPAGSGEFTSERLAKYYRIIARDADDLSQGVIMLLCINDCAADLADLPEAVDAPLVVTPPKPAETDAPVTVQTAKPDKDPATDPAPVDRPEVTATPLPPAEPGIPYSKLWASSLLDLVEPVFLFEGQEVTVPPYQIACRDAAPAWDANLARLATQLYGPECLQFDEEYEAASARLVEASVTTERLVVNVALARKRSAFLKRLVVGFEIPETLYLDCTLSVRFAETPGTDADPVFAGKSTRLFTGRDISAGWFLREQEVQALFPDKARLDEIAIEITAPQDADNQACRLAEPVILSLRDADSDPRVSIDLDGVVTISEVRLLPNAATEYFFLNTYLGASLVGTAEQGEGVYAFTNQRSDLLHYLAAYVDFAVEDALEESRSAEFVFFAPDENGLHREVARLTPLEMRQKPDWLRELLGRFARVEPNAEYADVRVTAVLDELRAAGALSADVPTGVHVVGRTGFSDRNDYCDPSAFLGYEGSTVSIVEFASGNYFPDLASSLGEENTVRDADVRTLRCRDQLNRHIIIFPDSVFIRPTPDELSVSFQGLKGGNATHAD
ncbi:MAG: hypothetical protein KI788_04460 [Mameliella sp.]|nr:hypothetical protein [Mameliella sp.]